MREMRTQPGVSSSFFETLRYPGPEIGPLWRRALARALDLRNIGWDIGIRAMERSAGLRHGERLDVKLGASARDLITEKGRAVRDEVEALVDSVMRAGSYAAHEEALRALHAVLDAARDRLPPDLLLKLSDHLPDSEAARLRASIRETHPTP